jgi:hypothetical protein
VIAEKIEELRHYDVPAMDRVAAICFFGKSGSLLLASFLDGHEDVVMLPALCGTDIYKFFERYQPLSLRDKLIGYPAHAQQFAPLFEGDFAISSFQYYAAVQAILELYREWPPDFLSSRRAFFLFVHIAYNLALGRRPASSRPLIVYAQHFWNDVMARQLIEDFPRAKFIHTIRDPITLSGQMLADRLLPGEPSADSSVTHPGKKNPPRLTLAAWCVATLQRPVDLLRRRHFRVFSPINGDRPHFGMESRTRAVRFEDLHCATAETMRDLSHWLGLAYRATLIESTFNGIPWVVVRNGIAWSGSRPEQARRNLRYISLNDRGLLFALFYKNFETWNYPYPKLFRNFMVRCIVFVSLVLIPMKVEIMGARAIFRSRILPALRHGKISVVINSLLRIVFYRMAIISLFTLEFVGRCTRGKALLQLDHEMPPQGYAVAARTDCPVQAALNDSSQVR